MEQKAFIVEGYISEANLPEDIEQLNRLLEYANLLFLRHYSGDEPDGGYIVRMKMERFNDD